MEEFTPGTETDTLAFTHTCNLDTLIIFEHIFGLFEGTKIPEETQV